jgi:hypothetical protein
MRRRGWRGSRFIRLQPPVGDGISRKIPGVLSQHMGREDTTRPVRIGVALYVGVVLAIALIFEVRFTTPVAGVNMYRDYDSVVPLKGSSWKRALSLLPKVMRDWGIKGVPGKSIGCNLSSIPQHLSGGSVASSGKVSEDPNVGSGMMGLEQVTELGSNLDVGISNSNSDALSVDPKELVVRDLWAYADSDSIPLFSHDVLVNPFLGLKVFPGVAEHGTSSGMRIGTCSIGKHVVQRLVQKSCEHRRELLIQEIIGHGLGAA